MSEKPGIHLKQANEILSNAKCWRFNPSCNLSQNDSSPHNQKMNANFLGFSSPQGQQQYPPEVRRERYFNSPQVPELAESAKGFVGENFFPNNGESNEPTESNQGNTSATTKALSQLELEGADKKKWKKAGKIPTALKRKKLNQRLSKLLTPKSALILLHELKPGCVYKVQGQEGCIPPTFTAQVEFNDEILGTGQGLSKSQAKNSAAENAIKAIVLKTMSRCTENKQVGDGDPEEEKDDTPENLPWAGLASFAIYKMFSEWQTQSTDVLPMARPVTKKKLKLSAVNAPMKKDLPPNATDLHPAVVLNMVNPGLTAVELERDDTPKCRVKMAYEVDGKLFSGVGGNKKDAKKEAAKAVLEGLYGLTFR